MISKQVNLLSIQVGLYGLSFLSVQGDHSFFRQIPYWAESPFAFDEVLNKIYKENWTDIKPDQLIVFHDNDLNTMVPRNLFEPSQADVYLKNTVKLLPGDTISYDENLPDDTVNVYVPFENVNNFFLDRFGEFDFFHFASSLLIYSYRLHDRSQTEIFTRITSKNFQILVWKQGRLIFYNTFPKENIDDFLYYFFFVWEQHELKSLNPAVKLISDKETADDILKNLNEFIEKTEYISDAEKKLLLQKP